MVRRLYPMKVSNKLLKQHTYPPGTRPPEFSDQDREITFAEAEALIRNLERNKASDKLPNVLWNHALNGIKDASQGRVVDGWISDDELFFMADLEEGLLKNAVDVGAIDNVSLRHRRPDNVNDFEVVELSLCHQGKREGTGVMLHDVCASADADEPLTVIVGLPALSSGVIEPPATVSATELSSPMSDAPPATVEPPVAATEPVDMDAQDEPIDSAGHASFLRRVAAWNKEGKRADDAKPGESVDEYRLRMYAENHFLDEDSSVLMMDELAHAVEREKKSLDALTSVIESVMRTNKGPNRPEISDKQRADAARKVEKHLADSKQFIPQDVQTKLIDVMASNDAVREHKPTRTEELELEYKIEQAKLEAARLNEQASKRVARTEKAKNAVKQEAYHRVSKTLAKRQKYTVDPEPRVEEDAAMDEDEPVDKAADGEFKHPVDLSGVRRPWDATYKYYREGNDIQGKVYPDEPPRLIRGAMDMARANGWTKNLNFISSKEHFDGQVGGGTRDSVCSEEYQQRIQGDRFLGSAFASNLDKAVLFGGPADPGVLINDEKSFVRLGRDHSARLMGHMVNTPLHRFRLDDFRWS